ncbi:MAG: ABC transporter ATP-binding protein [Acidimicrobiales bacterium]
MTDADPSPTPSTDTARAPKPVGATAPVLDLRNVSVTIDGRPVLHDLSWTVRPGEHWVVVGPNGGGKSTLLRVASLQLHPSTGSITILGHELGRIDIRPLRARIGISAASLTDQLRGRLTAEEIVRCGLHGALEPWWHRYAEADTARAEALLARVGLGGYGPRRFATLSSGERQRVLLARTLMPEPDLVLLDEPTAGLDFGGREELVAALDAIAADPSAGPTVLVTHRVEDIPGSATHLLAVAGGRVVAAGEIGSTLTAEVLGRTFGLVVRLDRVDGRWAASATLPLTGRPG